MRLDRLTCVNSDQLLGQQFGLFSQLYTHDASRLELHITYIRISQSEIKPQMRVRLSDPPRPHFSAQFRKTAASYVRMPTTDYKNQYPPRRSPAVMFIKQTQKCEKHFMLYIARNAYKIIYSKQNPTPWLSSLKLCTYNRYTTHKCFEKSFHNWVELCFPPRWASKVPHNIGAVFMQERGLFERVN